MTPRETEIPRLLVKRLIDREIAAALSISSRSVMHHISNLRTKIGARNRREAAAGAAAHDIA